MARYIDADRLMTKIHELYVQPNIELWQVVKCVGNSPTADVVLKREYDAVVSAVDNSTKEFLKLHDAYQDAKREVEEYKHNWQKIHDSYNTDCLEHYNKGRQDAAREIFEELRQKRNELWNKGNYTMFECWCKAEEELEKKYMEV